MQRNLVLHTRARLAGFAAVLATLALAPATRWPSGRLTASGPTLRAATTTAAGARGGSTSPASSTTTCWRCPGAPPSAPTSASSAAIRNAARAGRPYAFVLHGLWPQYERGWPQDCSSPDRGFVPRPVASRMLDIMPSERLVFHEYRKHGTCSGLGVDGYFDLARRLYDKVKIPPRFVDLTDARTTVSPAELMQDFMAANPGLEPDMIVVQCGGAGNRLKEVRICFDKGGDFRACGRNENQARLCRADRMYVPPVRLGAGERRDREPTGQQAAG